MTRLSISSLIYIVSLLVTSILCLPADSHLATINVTAHGAPLNAYVTCWDKDAEHGEISEKICDKTFRFLLSSPGSMDITIYTAMRRVFSVGPCSIVLDFTPGTQPTIALSVTSIVYESQRILGVCASYGAGGSIQFEQQANYHLGVGQNLIARPGLANPVHNPNAETA